MAHPYAQHKGKHHSKERVKKVFGHFARGGATHSDEAADRKLIKEELKKHDVKSHGSKSKERLDKHARGGKVKGGKGHHTKINIVIAPKGNDAPPTGGPPMPPPGAGAAPPPPPMPPKAPMSPPPGPMAAGMPGMGAKPGGMKRGGGVKPMSGISSPENLKKWADYAGQNTRYERGGAVLNTHTGGGGSASGRLAKLRSYGKKAKTNGPI